MLQGAARIFLLTKKSVVLADQKTGQVKASVPLPDLASVSVSTQTDGFFALKLKEVRLAQVPPFLIQLLMGKRLEKAVFELSLEQPTARLQQQGKTFWSQLETRLADTIWKRVLK